MTDLVPSLLGIDWALDGADRTIITNMKAEPIKLCETTYDGAQIAAVMKQLQAEIEKTSSIPPEWFIHEGRIYRNTKEGIIAYAFNP